MPRRVLEEEEEEEEEGQSAGRLKKKCPTRPVCIFCVCSFCLFFCLCFLYSSCVGLLCMTFVCIIAFCFLCVALVMCWGFVQQFWHGVLQVINHAYIYMCYLSQVNIGH